MSEFFPKISIIVPVYKVEQYLSQCVESILMQTFQDWELLLVDDGSPDNSGQICDEYALKDSRITVFHKENGGVSSARNLGIENARGEWITFVDSDDYIQTGFLAGLYAPIVLGEDIDFVHGGCVNVKNEEIVSINQSYEYYVGDDKNILFQKLRGLTVSKLFRSETVKHRPDGLTLLFDEKMRIAEDMAFTMDYALYVKRFALVPETGYCYRIDNIDSATKTRRVDSYDVQKHSFEHLYNSITRFIKDKSINKESYSYKIGDLGRQLIDACLSLYYSDFKRKERVKILKRDLKNEYLSLIEVARIGKLKKTIFLMLFYKKYYMFDIVLSIIMHFKK